MSNTLQSVTPRLLAMGLKALRQAAIMPQLVNQGYSSMAGERGSTIDIPIPSAIAIQQVNPGAVPPSTGDIAPTNVSIQLNNWYEAPFYLSDQDMLTAMNGTIPMQASEAIKAVANQVNSDLLSLYKSFYSIAGTAGTTPFASSTIEVTTARKQLNKELAPIDDRRVVINPDAEANALSLPNFAYAMYAGTDETVKEGTIGRKLGFDWYPHQLVWSHAPGSITGTVTFSGAQAADSPVSTSEIPQTITLATAGGASFQFNQGDIITFSGDTQTYVVTATTGTTGASSTGTVQVYPKIRVAKVGTETVTLTAAHVANLAFHRDAIAFATRPLVASAEGLGHIIQSAVDPDSGLALRLEVSREFKRTRFSYDILYGFLAVRKELGARILG